MSPVIACLAGMVLVTAGAAGAVGALYGLLTGLDWLSDLFPRAMMAFGYIIFTAAALVVLVIFYAIGCDIADALGWCNDCGLMVPE